MKLTFRTLLILLLVTILIMAYCSTPAEASIISGLKHRNRIHHRRPTGSSYTVKRKTKYKVKTKVRHGHRKPSIIKKIKKVG